MAGSIIPRWFRNISIATKLYFAMGIMAVLIALELFTLWFSVHTLSSVCVYIEGEGLWSKSQKDAVYFLQKYANKHDEKDFATFREFMIVPLGDHKARLELLKPDRDLDIARQGFIEGRNHPQDVDGMIQLFLRFQSISYIKRAGIAWSSADPLIFQLIPIGDSIHAEITSGHPSQQNVDALMDEVVNINDQVTKLEDDFSFALGEGSRWLENVILKLLFAVALTVEITGLLLTLSVSRSIQNGLDEILGVSKRIARGDFTARAKVDSEDELGILANSFNQMTAELERNTRELKDYARKLERSTTNLDQFAYVASHDLQEPLRTITNYTGLLEREYERTSDTATKRHMKYVIDAAARMRELVRDVLLFSRLGKDRPIEMVDCNTVVKDILQKLDTQIRENKALVLVDPLPELWTVRSEMELLFGNLIENAIKFRKPAVVPHILVKNTEDDRYWMFSISDNGIGINAEFKEKIFVIFQRLHNKEQYPGTGIGLATCKRIVEMNEGKIWVESEEGKGSTFYFTISKS